MSDNEYTSGVLLESLNEFMVKAASREQLEQGLLDLHKRYVEMKGSLNLAKIQCKAGRKYALKHHKNLEGDFAAIEHQIDKAMWV